MQKNSRILWIKSIQIIIIGILGFMLFSWILFSQEQPLKRQEIIKFSHTFHQQDVETTCTDCHSTVQESSTAEDRLLPTMEDCENCHDVEDEENCTQCHFEDEETWMALEVVSGEIIFNHKLHLEQESVTCDKCHKNLNEVEFANAESMPAMQECSNCHNNQQATLECVICHTNTLTLRPVDHSADFLTTHKSQARIDQEDCAICHTDYDCAECHEGASLIGFASGSNVDIQTPFGISTNGTKGLILTRVHELNFRYTHPLQAQGRSLECTVCHEARNFCQECHESQGIDVAGKPIWHSVPDWGALAGMVGSGGGRHAELAKRDIENCTACHDTQGDDPTCLLCHMDRIPGKGNDPITHERGFANRFGEDASFHDDPSALCFACHTDTGPSGPGFCVYCHEQKN